MIRIHGIEGTKALARAIPDSATGRYKLQWKPEGTKRWRPLKRGFRVEAESVEEAEWRMAAAFSGLEGVQLVERLSEDEEVQRWTKMSY